MEHSNRRYTSEEVSDIVRLALDSGTGSADTIGHDELLDIADRSGISRADLEAAIEQKEKTGKLDHYKREWILSQKKEFFDGLKGYIFWMVVLSVFNFLTSDYPWVLWPMIGWGIAVLFSASETFFPSEEKIEKGALTLLNEELKEKEKVRQEKFEAFMAEY
jgi:hypothetical protein